MKQLLRALPIKRFQKKQYPLVKRYLYDLNGIEIGGSGRDYGLASQKGSYANIDIIDAETRAKNKGWKKSQLVNILSSGDDLPFKDDVFDYVFSSHVIEHFFDPIKAIKEWHRVIKKSGYIFMVIPHKERTFDRNRDITEFEELERRHQGKIKVSDYIQRTKEQKLIHETEKDKDHHKLIYGDDVPNGWERFDHYDFMHHWSVWDTETFMELCKKMGWKILDHEDTKQESDNEFIIVLQK